jgi:hypothetical protein
MCLSPIILVSPLFPHQEVQITCFNAVFLPNPKVTEKEGGDYPLFPSLLLKTLKSMAQNRLRQEILEQYSQERLTRPNFPFF